MPILENDVPTRSEHGHAITNHYRVEPRLGGEAAYKKLSDALHQRGMKLVQDAVYNHVGETQVTILDKPDPEWVHNWPQYTIPIRLTKTTCCTIRVEPRAINR